MLITTNKAMLLRLNGYHAYALLLSIGICSYQSFAEVPECQTKILGDIFTNPIYIVNSTKLPSMFPVTEVTSNSTECFFSLDDHLFPFLRLANGSASFGGIGLVCRARLLVHLRLESNETFENIIGQFETMECVLRTSHLTMVSKIFTLYNVGSKNGTFIVDDNSTDCWMKNLYTLSLFSPNIEPTNTGMFPCYNDKLMELTFTNSSLEDIPSIIPEYYPNLQSLGLGRNRLSKPPDFPWANVSEVQLPSGLSRTLYFQSHYTNPFGIIVPNNRFRRILALDQNRITRLDPDAFDGFFDIISLKNNELANISRLAFRKARSLQAIRMSHNNIEILVDATFQYNDNLRQLHIDYNKLKFLNDLTLLGLEQLEVLKLGHNNISKISTDCFRHVVHLTELSLEHNKITFVTKDMFEPLSKLEDLDLSHNPISGFPSYLLVMRLLDKIHLGHTHIDLAGFDEILYSLNSHALWSTSSNTDSDLYTPPSTKRSLDLSSCRVETLEIPISPRRKVIKNLALLLINFDVNLSGNPFVCDSNILPTRRFLLEMVHNHNFTGTERYYSEWACSKPVELNGKVITSIEPDQTYSATTDPNCPDVCACYQRSISKRVIVDCRGLGLTEMPGSVPNGMLELWLQDNNITVLEYRSYLKRSHVIDLSNTALNTVHKEAVTELPRESELNLANNYLSYVPKSLEHTSLKYLHLSDNPFVCDCHSLWMKNWILMNVLRIPDWDSIACSTLGDKSGKVVEIDDGLFVCAESPDKIKILLAPILSAVILVGLTVVAVIIVYIFRYEICFLVFVHFKIRILYKDTLKSNERYTVFLVYPQQFRDVVEQKLQPSLMANFQRTDLYDPSDDFIVGLPNKKNVDIAVSVSRRMFYIYFGEQEFDDVTKYALTAAENKCKNGRPNYFVLVCLKSVFLDKNLHKSTFIKQFIRAKRVIILDNTNILDRIRYFCPNDTNRQFTDEHFVGTNETMKDKTDVVVENSAINYCAQDFYLSTAYQDFNFLKTLMEELEKLDYKLCIPDRNFLPGVPKGENITKGVHSSQCTVICLSTSHCLDEWTLFTFQVAEQHCLSNRVAHLIVILMDDLDGRVLDESIHNYISSHTCIKHDDKNLVVRLTAALRYVRSSNVDVVMLDLEDPDTGETRL